MFFTVGKKCLIKKVYKNMFFTATDLYIKNSGKNI